MRQVKVALIAGTRPEAIKLAPLLKQLRRRPAFAPTMIATGQHPVLLRAALAEFGLRADHDLALPNKGLEAFCASLATALSPLLAGMAPDLVLVQGDTSSAWVAARVADALGLPVGHVEAGLRSGDERMPWPEERNRREIDALSTLLFAPSARAAGNLRDASGRVVVTGNTGIDALFAILEAAPPRLRETGIRLLLVTCHRREAIPRLADLCAALLALAARPDVHIHLPVHPNPAVAETLRARLGGHPNILIETALPYRDLVALLGRADLLLTDSGGLQEEAPALGLPTLVLRDVTERPEPVTSGNARLVGLDRARILHEATRLLDDPTAYAAMARPSFPYGRGDAATKIADAIEDWWSSLSP